MHSCVLYSLDGFMPKFSFEMVSGLDLFTAFLIYLWGLNVFLYSYTYGQKNRAPFPFTVCKGLLSDSYAKFILEDLVAPE